MAFKIKGDVRFDNNAFLNIEKNNEDILLNFHSRRDYTKFCKNTFLQKKYGVFNNENVNTKILETLEERNCNWVLLDNNLNFINCFIDKEHNKRSMEFRSRFLANKEKWGIGELEKVPISSNKPIQTVKLIHNVDTPRKTNFKFRKRKTTLYSQPIFLHKTREFVYIPKTYDHEEGFQVESVGTLFNSELVYLFHRGGGIGNKSELYLHTVFNRSWFYT